MSLPAEYSALLNDLNRDVLRQQPSDPLQYCASWFFARLELERSSSRRQSPPPPSATAQALSPPTRRSITPPAPLTNIPAATPPRQPVRPAEQAGLAEGGPAEGYRFGGGGPTSNAPTATRDAPSPFGKSSQLPSSRSTGGPSRSAMEALAKRASVAIARPRTDSDDERSMMDDRSTAAADSDDDHGHRHHHPAAGSRLKRPSSGASSNGLRASPYDDDDQDDEPMPPGINLGRRTSVSAESLTPSMLNGPPAPKVVIPKTPSQRERIEASISGNLLFRNLDEGQYGDVLNAMKEVRVGRGTEVIVQGAVGDYFYVVEEGSFDVYVRGPPTYTYVPASTPANQPPSDRNTPSPSRGGGQTITTQAPSKKVHTYGPGGSFGELALMYNAPRAATVVATSPSATLWALDRVTFRSILMEHTSRKRGMYESFLASVPILGSLTPQEISKVADALEQRTFGEGDSVVREGEPGKEFYIVESGRAEVLKRARNGGQDVVGALKTGDYFGELALINSAPRAATVRVAPGTGRLRVACLGEKAFTRLLGPVIEILARKAEDYDRVGGGGSGPSTAAQQQRYGGGQQR